MSGLVRVTIDGRAVEVPPGTLITEAARLAGVHIPVFCSHPKLEPLGACRICLVEIGLPRRDRAGNPVLGADGSPEIAWGPKPEASCTRPVSEGMVVATDSPVAVRARQGIMEFLLVNHPLDCPVCDEGGECQLQDLAFAFGREASRATDPKRTFVSEDLGPVVKKEANRCIACLRCVRYCHEVMGDDALTAHQRGVRTEISSFDRQPLRCQQCGNCVEVCPVGALTALPYRFQARPWDLRQQVTICPSCASGCSVRLGVRGTEVLRARGTERRGVNEEYLCARGRFGAAFVNDAGRLAGPLVRRGAGLEPATFDEAVAFAAEGLRAIAARDGGGAIAFLGGETLGLEEQYLLQRLARSVLRTNHVDARTRLAAPLPGAAVLRATGGGRPLVSLEELGRTREVLVLEDLLAEAPLVQATLTRGIRQQGVHVTVAFPRAVRLTESRAGGDWLRPRPGTTLALLNGLARAALDLGDPAGLPAGAAAGLPALRAALAAWGPERVERETGVPAGAVAAAARRLREAPSRAIVFGRSLVEHPDAAALLQAVENLGWATGALAADRSCVLCVGAHAGSQGALDMGLAPDLLPGYVPVADAAGRAAFEARWGAALDAAPGRTAPEILEAAAEGRIKALWIAGDDWLRSAPDRALAERALARAELVIATSLFPTATVEAAHVVFPAAAFAEKEGAVVSAERRVQRTVRALAPRQGARADGDVVRAVARALGAAWPYRSGEDVFREIARLVPGYEGLSSGALLPLGPRWSVAEPRVAATLAPAGDGAVAVGAPSADGDGLWLLAGGSVFAHEGPASRVALLARLEGPARARLAGATMRRLGLAAGEGLTIEGPAGALTLPAEPDEGVPEGAVLVPSAHPAVDLNRLGRAAASGLRVRARRAAARDAEVRA